MCSTVQTECLIVQVSLARSLTDFGRYLAGTFIAWDPQIPPGLCCLSMAMQSGLAVQHLSVAGSIEVISSLSRQSSPAAEFFAVGRAEIVLELFKTWDSLGL
jgi:hypothetical protein